MKIRTLKNIELTEDEVMKALVDYLIGEGCPELADTEIEFVTIKWDEDPNTEKKVSLSWVEEAETGSNAEDEQEEN